MKRGILYGLVVLLSVVATVYPQSETNAPTIPNRTANVVPTPYPVDADHTTRANDPEHCFLPVSRFSVGIVFAILYFILATFANAYLFCSGDCSFLVYIFFQAIGAGLAAAYSSDRPENPCDSGLVVQDTAAVAFLYSVLELLSDFFGWMTLCGNPATSYATARLLGPHQRGGNHIKSTCRRIRYWTISSVGILMGVFSIYTMADESVREGDPWWVMTLLFFWEGVFSVLVLLGLYFAIPADIVWTGTKVFLLDAPGFVVGVFLRKEFVFALVVQALVEIVLFRQAEGQRQSYIDENESDMDDGVAQEMLEVQAEPQDSRSESAKQPSEEAFL